MIELLLFFIGFWVAVYAVILLIGGVGAIVSGTIYVILYPLVAAWAWLRDRREARR